jgi:hypothetical protein
VEAEHPIGVLGHARAWAGGPRSGARPGTLPALSLQSVKRLEDAGRSLLKRGWGACLTEEI